VSPWLHYLPLSKALSPPEERLRRPECNSEVQQRRRRVVMLRAARRVRDHQARLVPCLSLGPESPLEFEPTLESVNADFGKRQGRIGCRRLVSRPSTRPATRCRCQAIRASRASRSTSDQARPNISPRRSPRTSISTHAA
jgi:hypothetical protein